MASLVVSPLLELVIEKVASALTEEYGLLQGVKNDMSKLQSLLSTINAVLEDAEMRPAIDKPLSNWLRKLKDAAYDADDVLDEFQTEASRQHMKVRDFFSSSHNPTIFRHKIARKIKDVLKRFDEIAKERNDFHLQGSVSRSLDNERETNSVVIESEVIGRASEKEKIINFLINEENDKDLPVLAIVGMGGQGKTTLAQLVYNDDRVTSFFDLQKWVYVSSEFDAKDIVRKIIGCEHDKLTFELMNETLRNTISGKRLFLVLDDVWNEDSVKWEDLRKLLRCSGKGSKLVTTTRSTTVARVMDSTVEPLCLRGLSIDDCWTLFRERAFGPGREKETPELVKIGKEIVNKCGGLPLAAKALGSLMSLKRGESEWLAVNNSEIWRITDEENKILPALKLSYYHLPAKLKQCFVYCSLFPKGYTLKKKQLISRWIGEGFVSSSNNDILLEDIANRYFNNLLSRSFFQEAIKDEFEDITDCKMHDLIHDLACEVAKDEFCMEVSHKGIRLVSDCRYLRLTMPLELLDIPWKTLKLRSFALTRYNQVEEIDWDVSMRQRHLRLLDFGYTYFQTVPSNICRLQHLRFLNLSYSKFKRLPKTIGNLYNLSILILSRCSELVELPSTIVCLQNLRTLDLSWCTSLVQLPSGLSNMSNLSHLHLLSCDKLRGMPAGMGQLTNLRTLSTFIVSEEEGWHINELKHLNLIRGSLVIKSLEKVRKPAEAKEANLGAKTSMKHLELVWRRWWEAEENVAEEEKEEEEAVIENLRPPPNLVVFRVEGYGGSRLPSWIMSSSSSSSLFLNLVEIQFWGMRRCECFPHLGHLPCLKRLRVWVMEGVRRLGEEEFYEEHQQIKETGGNIVVPVIFPKLEELEFEGMKNLEEWVVVKEAATGADGGGGDIIIKRENMFPSLRKLTISNCSKLVSVRPGLPLSVVELHIRGRISEEVVSARILGGLHKLKTLSINFIQPTVILESSSLLEGLQCLTNLTTLWIRSFEGLTCLPEGMIQLHIPTLRDLDLCLPGKLTSLGSGCGGGGGDDGDEGDQQEEIPPILFTSLHHLSIQCFDELRALPEWMGGLTSLHSLTISYCRKLEKLPDGLQRLRSLDRLSIDGCPIVQRRCQSDTGGEDWHKISHIPNLHIQSVPENSNNNNSRASAATTTTNIRGWIPEGLPSCFGR